VQRVTGSSRGGTIIALAFATLAALLGGVATPASAAVDADAERAFVEALNGERARAGLPALTVCSELRTVARRHSATMAAENLLHHNPNLATDVLSWQRIAENVGRGPGVSSLHGALMDSDGHRRNILDARVSQLGIGVEVIGSSMWVTQVFRLPTSGATCSSTATTSASATAQVRLEGDFTGNGATDVAVYHPSTGNWVVARSDGSGFTHERWARFTTRTGWSHHVVGDFDGDGRDDIASYHPGAGTWWVSRSTGSSFGGARWARFTTRTGWSHHVVGDFDGDGRDDVASYHPGAEVWWVSHGNIDGFRVHEY
jgi:hypothetical protein